MVLIISSMYWPEMTNIIPFPALMTLRIFLWIALSIAEADPIVANGASTFIAKGTQLSSMEQLICIKKAPRDPPDWITLDNWPLLSC